MNSFREYVAHSPQLKKLISSLPKVRKVAQCFVPGESLEQITDLLIQHQEKGFGTILYPIQGTAQQYLEAIAFLAQREVTGSVSLRASMQGIESVAEYAADRNVGIEIDMRHLEKVDETIQTYRRIKEIHTHAVLCLQSNLHRTAQDIEALADCAPSVRVVKGAFSGEKTYRSREAISLNFLWLVKSLVHAGRKTYLATHDEKLIKEFLTFAEYASISNELFAFQMLHGVQQKLQKELRQQGHEVHTYVAYGTDWLPYLLNRLAERKGNIRFAYKALKRGYHE